MTPRTERGAVEKLYRVRWYLNSQMIYGRLTFEEIIAFGQAFDRLTKIQSNFY